MRVILCDNVQLCGTREYLVRGVVIDENNQKLSRSGIDMIFTGDKAKMADKNLLIGNSIVSLKDGSIWVRLYMPDGGSKTLHAGSVLGYAEEWRDDKNQNTKRSICSLSEISKHREISRLSDICYVIEKNMDEVAESVKNETMHIIKKNIDIFSKYSLDVGLTNVIEHTIDTGEAKPIAFKPRRIPIGLEEVVNSKVKELEHAGIIRQSNSPWNFPLVIVKKKNEDIRLCVDYRGLNAKTDRPIYPIPASEEIFDAIGEAKYFSTLDLSSGYYQIPIKSDDMKKTAFTTKHGQFEFTRMPFGLCSAPATFQKMMNIILQRENWSKCLIYLDDVLIFGRTIKEHNERLSLVLQRIKEAGLKLSPEKCCILKTRVHYLGHVIDADGVRTDPDKISILIRYTKNKYSFYFKSD